MSQMDGIPNINSYVAQAAEWGHKAIAVTDHNGVQAFPDAHSAAKAWHKDDLWNGRYVGRRWCAYCI